VLAVCRVLEQLLALDHGAQRCSGLGEERVCDLRLDRPEPTDHCSVGLTEPAHGARTKIRAAEQRQAGAAPEHGFRLGADATAWLACATEGEDALEPLGGAPPERDLRENVEADQEIELRLGREERGQLEQPGISGGLAEQHDPGGGQGEGASLGDGRRGAANVSLVQLESGSELDYRSRGIEDGGEIVADIWISAAGSKKSRSRQDRVERGLHGFGAALQEVRMQSL